MNTAQKNAAVFVSALLSVTALAQLEVTSTGVGIGTPNPSYPLHIQGATPTTSGLGVRNDTAGATGGLYVDNSAILSLGQPGVSQHLNVNLANGYVGIGTAAPAAKFTLVGGHGDTHFRLFSTSYGQGVDGANTAVLNLWASEPNATWAGTGIGNNVTNSNGPVRITDARGGSYMRLLDTNIVLSTIDATGVDQLGLHISAGNVGVGATATATYKLTIGGSVRASSFISNTTTYADFVFRPDYQLPALSDVEAHIQEHGHLPGIPSEAEAMAQGIDLAAMQVKLLQKIEEITLHQIRQAKEIAALKEENERLQRQLTALSF